MDDPSSSEPRPSSLPAPEPGRDVADEDFLFHLYRGSELLQDELVHEAKAELEHALTYQPRDARGQDLLGVVYFRLGLFPRAIQIYETLRNQNPKEPSVRLNLALCYLKTAQAGRAKEELESLIKAHPEHKRAWGYLGLSYERLGDLARARDAFERGGHTQMAKRIARTGVDTAGRPSERPPPPQPPLGPAEPAIRAARQEVSVVFQELDAGELSFSLAAPSLTGADGGTSWRSVELGGTSTTARPAQEAQQPSARSQVTLPAPDTTPGLAPPPAPPTVDAQSSPLPTLDDLARRAEHLHPGGPAVLVERGSALVTVSGERPFAARLEALRAYSGELTCELLARTAGKGEPVGGLGAPLARLSGAAHAVLGARAGRTLLAMRLRPGEVLAVREDRLLGFELTLTHASVRLTPETDSPRLVELRGAGVVVLELIASMDPLTVGPTRHATARRDAVVGWGGELTPRPLSTAEAPSGQRGLVRFEGSGVVLVSTQG